MNIPLKFLLWERYVYLANKRTLNAMLRQVQLCQCKPDTGETQESLMAAFRTRSPLLLLPDSVLSPLQRASCNQITLKWSENWAGNSTTLLETKGLCFIGCSKEACEHYVWCLKYCSSNMETYWLSSGSQIFFYLHFMGQPSEWKVQLLGSAKYNLIPSTCKLPSLFALSCRVQEGAVRTQNKI